MASSMTRRQALASMLAIPSLISLASCAVEGESPAEIAVPDAGGSGVEIDVIQPRGGDEGVKLAESADTASSVSSEFTVDSSLDKQPGSDKLAASVNGLYAPQLEDLVSQLMGSCPYTNDARDRFIELMSSYGIECDSSCFEAFTEDGQVERFDARRPDIKMAVVGKVHRSVYVVNRPDESLLEEPEGEVGSGDLMDGDRVVVISLMMYGGYAPVENNDIESSVKKALRSIGSGSEAAKYGRYVEFSIPIDGDGNAVGPLTCSRPSWWM